MNAEIKLIEVYLIICESFIHLLVFAKKYVIINSDNNLKCNFRSRLYITTLRISDDICIYSKTNVTQPNCRVEYHSDSSITSKSYIRYILHLKHHILSPSLAEKHM